jgi:SAM-dependent methyltransferase
MKERRAVFEQILRTNSWGERETASGPGSTRDRAAALRSDLVSLLERLRVRSVLDAPCGDFHWMSALDLPVERYIGLDIVAEIVARNVERHSAPGRTFLIGDLIDAPLPRADLILCRDALVHFPLAEARAALRNFKRSGSAWLLATHFRGERTNEEIVLGDWRPLNLERLPFHLPPAVDEVDERLGGDWADKRLALWWLAGLALD